jgi:hypothetical protein
VENAVANPGFEDGDTAPWSTNGAKAAVSTVTAHSGKYSLAETGAGTVYQDINGLEPGATYTLSAWVSGSAGDRTSAQIIIYNPAIIPRPHLSCVEQSKLAVAVAFVYCRT